MSTQVDPLVLAEIGLLYLRNKALEARIQQLEKQLAEAKTQPDAQCEDSCSHNR